MSDLDSRQLRKLLRTNTAIEILDLVPGLHGSDWGCGGCHFLARAMREAFGGEVVVIARAKDRRIEHSGLLYKGLIYDGDGSHPPEDWIPYYQRNDDLYLDTEYAVMGSDEAVFMEQELDIPEEAVARLADFLIAGMSGT